MSNLYKSKRFRDRCIIDVDIDIDSKFQSKSTAAQSKTRALQYNIKDLADKLVHVMQHCLTNFCSGSKKKG